jgi:GDP-L-fucose synthase
MCQAFKRQYGDNFISAIPSNTYGEGDNFDPEHSHVIPAMMRRFHEAKVNNAPEVVCWGTGRPVREFLYVDDVADAIVFLMQNYNDEEHINIGGGRIINMEELANKIAYAVDFNGMIRWDTERPDGLMVRCLNDSKIRSIGWTPKIDILDGLEKTYKWYLQSISNDRRGT